MFNAWKEFILKDSSSDRLNENVEKIADIVKVCRSRSTNYVLRTLSRNKDLVLIGQNQIDESLFLIHNMRDLSGEMGSNVDHKVGL